MKQRIIRKVLAVAVIILFIGLAIQPSVAVQPETEIEIEPKDYLFQTIIDFANNPDIKELLEQYKPDLFKVDIDRSVYRKLFFRNPRLLFDTLFTKPSMTVEYLNKCYNNGIGITNILGEDKVLEILENFEVADTKLFDELDNIISKDEELTSRFETLKEMNKELDSNNWFPPICFILIPMFMFVLLLFNIDILFATLITLLPIPIISQTFGAIFYGIGVIMFLFVMIFAEMLIGIGCVY